MAYEGSPGKVSGETGIMEVVLSMEGPDSDICGQKFYQKTYE